MDTSNERTTSSAASQFPSPGWLAVTTTSPAPVNVNTFPSNTAGPATAKVTANPLSAAASSATVFVATCAPISAKSMRWVALAMTKVPVELPSHKLSTTVATTAWLPAFTGHAASPS